jgi:hypothetical protein
MKHVKTQRNKARASAMKRKEEYLGARVPRELRAKVIARADELGIPVSILIRNILEEAFKSTVTVAASKSGTRSGEQEINTPDIHSKDEYPTVIGWETMTLNRAMTCTACGDELKPGREITLGLAGPGENHVILCGKCKKLA